jgi:peptidyl-prolyl cis-trans isomerase C
MLVAKAAEGKKIAETPEFQNRLTHLRNKLLAELMLQAETKAAVTDTAMRKVYDDATKGMGSEQEVRARHILIRVADQTDEKASKEAEDKIMAIIERINNGEDFAKLANELTEDPSGKQNGGDLVISPRSRWSRSFRPSPSSSIRPDSGCDQDAVRLARAQG